MIKKHLTMHPKLLNGSVFISPEICDLFFFPPLSLLNKCYISYIFKYYILKFISYFMYVMCFCYITTLHFLEQR